MLNAIRRFQSTGRDARLAVQAFRDSVGGAEAALVLFFCSSTFDLDVVADEMRLQFCDVPVFGCTTTGEIGPSGYLDHGLCGVAFPGNTFAAVGRLIPDLQQFQASQARGIAQELLTAIDSKTADRAELSNRFALSLIDGLSNREELVSRAFQLALDDISLVGGSAGDDLSFQRSHVYADGAFHTDAALVILLATSRPVRTLKIQNFVARQERLVVTGADPERRRVLEINGLPAAEEYARVIDVAPEQLTPARFADAPSVITLDDDVYVRAVRSANEDGSLTFYSAIDEGMVFRVSDMTDLLRDLRTSLAAVCQSDGVPSLLIGFDCILRKLSAANRQVLDEVSDVFRAHNAVGFSSYGEQYNGMHVNHTLTGVAIWDLPEGPADG